MWETIQAFWLAKLVYELAPFVILILLIALAAIVINVGRAGWTVGRKISGRRPEDLDE